MAFSMEIVILGDSLNALETLNSIGVKKANVLCVKDEECLVKYSFLSKRVYRLPFQTSKLIKYLKKQFGKNAILIPTTDFWVSFLLNYRKDLKDFKFYKCLEFVDKLTFAKFLTKNKFNTPKTISDRVSDDDIYIIKFNPKTSFDFLRKCKKYKIRKGPFKVPSNFIAQKLVKGNNISVAGIRTKEYLIMSLFEKVVERPKYGTAVVSKIFYSEKMKPLLKIAEEILKKSKYFGPFEIEFIVSKKKIYVLEMNPRLWLQHRLLLKLGINPVGLILSDLINNEKIHKKHRGLPKKIILKPTHPIFWINESCLLTNPFSTFTYFFQPKLLLFFSLKNPFLLFLYLGFRIKKYILGLLSRK